MTRTLRRRTFADRFIQGSGTVFSLVVWEELHTAPVAEPSHPDSGLEIPWHASTFTTQSGLLTQGQKSSSLDLTYGNKLPLTSEKKKTTTLLNNKFFKGTNHIACLSLSEIANVFLRLHISLALWQAHAALHMYYRYEHTVCRPFCLLYLLQCVKSICRPCPLSYPAWSCKSKCIFL